MPDPRRAGTYTATIIPARKRVWPRETSTGKGRDYRANWPYLIVKFLPYNKESDFYIFYYTVDLYIWKLNSCRPTQFINSILKPIIWYILCIVHVFTLTVDTIRWIIFPTWFLEITGALVGIWYEKLSQKWGIWQKYRVKSHIILTYPCTGLVGLTIDRCINNIIYVSDPIMYRNTENC